MKLMRTSMFSDYYLDQADGTAIAVGISREALERAGHQVYIYCPRLPGTPHGQRITSFRSMPAFIYSGLRACWPFSPRTLHQIDKQKLDIIHIHTPFLVGLAGLRAAKKLGKPLVMSAHLDMDFMAGYKLSLLTLPGLAFLISLICGQPRRFWHVIFQPRRRPVVGWRRDLAWRTFGLLAEQCDLVLAPSQKIYDQLKHYCPDAKLQLVPNGVDLPKTVASKAATRKQLGIRPGAFVVVSSSRHVREKQIELIILAFVRSLRSVPQAELYLLGSGPQRRKLKRLVVALGIADNVHLPGSLPHDLVFKYLAAADVYVNACLREVASLSILEAASSGLPLILRDRRLVEPLAENENGFFVDTPEQIGDRLAWLAAHPPAAAKMGKASAKRVRKTYGTAAHAKALERAYKKVV